MKVKDKRKASNTNIIFVGLFTGLIALFAQIKFNLGPIPFTLQNMGVILASTILSPLYSLLSISLYLFFIFIGLPFAAGFSGGPMVLFGFTSGYLWGFLFAAPFFSYMIRRSGLLRKILVDGLEGKSLFLALMVSLFCFLPVYLLGFLVFYHFAVPGSPLFDWSTDASSLLGINFDSRVLLIFFVSVLIFLPQDLFMDHLLGIIVGVKILRFLEERGIELT